MSYRSPVRLELDVLHALAHASPSWLSRGELATRVRLAPVELDRVLERLAGQIRAYPGLLFIISEFGRLRLGRDLVRA